MRKSDMPSQEIHDTIEVITLFDHGGLQPLRFRWNGRVYKISEVNSIWSLPQNQYRTYHFSVRSQGADCFEIVFDPESFHWQLARVSFGNS